jgi:hypothetical protein
MHSTSALTFALVLLAASPAAARAIEAGPIWNQADAQAKCQVVAASWGGKWTGQWWTTVQGRMSVCEITNIPLATIEAGPIWNQTDAQAKCPVVAASRGGKWTGQWWTTVQGRMSVCQLDLN